MIKPQQELLISNHLELYNILIDKDNILRKINELVDFSFIYDELLQNYSLNEGRGAKDPILMFKYLLLKVIYKLSDVDVVKRSLTDMSFKYFLNLVPEETDLINPSSLTKFRKLRLKNMNILDMLIGKTVEIALEKGVLLSKTLIVDATHTKSKYNKKSVQEVLLERAKLLRKEVYSVNENYKEKFPKKVTTGEIKDIITYCQDVAKVVETEVELSVFQKIQERLNYLNEAIEDDIEQLQLSKDADAKIGHKTVDTAFFGYKSHLGMSEERIITAAVITTGEKGDGSYLKDLIEKSELSGMKVKEVLGDTAYSGKDNIEYTQKKKIKLISKLNPTISQGIRKKEDEFDYNKDAGMYICPAGHIAIKKYKKANKTTKKNPTMAYFFDVEKCKKCHLKEGCYTNGAKTNSYSVVIKSNLHKEQIAFQETEYFKTRYKERYKIEAKNSEIKHRYGYDVSISSGLLNMEMQGALTIFTANMKRIITLMGK